MALEVSDRKIAVIGGSVSGTLIALLLRSFWLRSVEILEQGPHIFPPKTASFMNAGTLIHHLNFWWHPESFRKMILSSIFFRRFFPEDCFSSSLSRLLLPNKSDNAAIGDTSTGGSALNNLSVLREICWQLGETPYGNPNDISRSVTEADMMDAYGSIPSGFSSWLWDGWVFHSGFDVVQFFAHPDRIIDYLSHNIHEQGVIFRWNTPISQVEQGEGWYNVIDTSGENIWTYDVVIGAAHAWNLAIKWPWMPEGLPELIVRRKGLVLLDGRGLNIPSTVMIRGYYGALLPVWDGFFLAVSWKEFDLDGVKPWISFMEMQAKITQWNTQPIWDYSNNKYINEEDYIEKCLQDLEKFFPFVRNMKVCGAKFGTHIYHESREWASPNTASKRDETPIIHEHTYAQDRGVLVAGHTKLTTIPIIIFVIIQRIFDILGYKNPIQFDQYWLPIIPDKFMETFFTKKVPQKSKHFIPLS